MMLQNNLLKPAQPLERIDSSVLVNVTSSPRFRRLAFSTRNDMRHFNNGQSHSNQNWSDFPVTIEHMPFALSENDKFGIVAVHNAYTDLKTEQTQLSNGTWILQRVPFEIEKTWQKWLGSLKAEQLAKSNLVLIRAKSSSEP